jgi:hypothetical protein
MTPILVPWRLLLVSCLLCSATAVHAQLNNSLFTTEQQRSNLNVLRANYLARTKDRGFDITELEPEAQPLTTTSAPVIVTPTVYSLSGIIKKTDGSYRIWLNGASLDEGQLPSRLRLLREGTSLALAVSTPQGRKVLRPGQSINVDSGRIVESYQRPAAVSAATPANAPTTATPQASSALAADLVKAALNTSSQDAASSNAATAPTVAPLP